MNTLLPEQHNRAVPILEKTSSAKVFVYKDLLVKGNVYEVVKRFVMEESEKDESEQTNFKDWLIAKNLVLIKGFNNK